jgi:hypothetical protein
MMIFICMNSICEAANIVDFTWLSFLAWIVVQQLKDEASVPGKVHSGHHISGVYGCNEVDFRSLSLGLIENTRLRSTVALPAAAVSLEQG